MLLFPHTFATHALVSNTVITLEINWCNILLPGIVFSLLALNSENLYEINFQ